MTDDARPVVLVAEDDVDLWMGWSEALAERGLATAPAISVRDALVVARSQRVDAAIVDMFFRNGSGQMSNEGGGLLIRYLRRPTLVGLPKPTENIPIVAVTGSASPARTLSHARWAGADECLTKPVDPAALAGSLVKILRRVQGRADHDRPQRGLDGERGLTA